MDLKHVKEVVLPYKVISVNTKNDTHVSKSTRLCFSTHDLWCGNTFIDVLSHTIHWVVPRETRAAEYYQSSRTTRDSTLDTPFLRYTLCIHCLANWSSRAMTNRTQARLDQCLPCNTQILYPISYGFPSNHHRMLDWKLHYTALTQSILVWRASVSIMSVYFYSFQPDVMTQKAF